MLINRYGGDCERGYEEMARSEMIGPLRFGRDGLNTVWVQCQMCAKKIQQEERIRLE